MKVDGAFKSSMVEDSCAIDEDDSDCEWGKRWRNRPTTDLKLQVEGHRWTRESEDKIEIN